MSHASYFRSLRCRILLLVFLLIFSGPSRQSHALYASQDESKRTTDFNFTCTQNNREYILKTKLSFWNGERDIPIGGAAITYYNLVGEESGQLAVVRTDMEGVAVHKIEKGSDRLVSANHIYTFRALFKGNHQYEMAEEMRDVKPVDMYLEFVEIDSVKTIVARATEMDDEGELIPLEDLDVYIYATRSFSLLPVGEEWFMGGMASVGFPTTLPGDSAGNLTIIARIEDHELYGNVEAVGVKDWGLARPPVVVERRRGLGDTDAPLWMVYTLIVLLSIVWFHYLYVFYTMYRIKKLRQEVNYDSSKE